MVQNKILIATHNKGKLAEFATLLQPYGYDVVSAGELSLPEPDEIGHSFSENARLKARLAAQAANLPALADDSGLCVAAMNGAPGIFSARYANGDYPAAFTKIILACAEKQEFRARYVCALCFAQPDGTTATYIGQADGMIAKTPSGGMGFGYDPIFIPLGYEKTYAQLGAEHKDKISHRAQAFAQFAMSLR
jgi:XTP/dITP diphosphohydrolase